MYDNSDSSQSHDHRAPESSSNLHISRTTYSESTSPQPVVNNHGFPLSSFPLSMIKSVFAASLGGILFGYDLGIISAALPQLILSFDLTHTEAELVVSVIYIGAVFGSSIGGFLCDMFGRKRMILITDVVFMVGSIVLKYAMNFNVVLVGRVLIGCAVAISGIADVAYLHEISPIEHRGSIVSCNEICITFGIMMSYFVGYMMTTSFYDGNDNENEDGTESWRDMFGLASFFALFQFLCMLYMPESPVWLKERGRFEEAQHSLVRIYGDKFENQNGTKSVPQENEANDHYDSITVDPPPKDPTTPHDESYHAFNAEEYPPMQHSSTLKTSNNELQTVDFNDEIDSSQEQNEISRATVLSSSCQRIHDYHRQVVIAIFLAVMSPFCGHLNVINFAPTIFEQIGFKSESEQLLGTFLVGLAKFITTCLVIYKIDDVAFGYGRRFLLILGMCIIAASLFSLTVVYIGSDKIEKEDDDGVDVEYAISSGGTVIATIGVFGVAIGYATSFGPLGWVVISELFPNHMRGRALGLSTTITYMASALVSYTFLSGQDAVGPSGPFAFYFALTCLSIIFTFTKIPETGRKTPDEIHSDLATKWSSASSFCMTFRKKGDYGVNNRETKGKQDSSEFSRTSNAVMA